MMLLSHIVIALASLAFTGYLYLRPSPVKFRAAYVLTGLTIGTGTWLVVANPAHMVQSCIMGLVYLGIVFFGIALARNKLAAEHQEADKR